MTVQLPLPGHWPRNMSRRDPEEALAEIQRDRLEAKYRLRLVLDEFAEKHGIRLREVNKLVHGYVDDMLDDLLLRQGASQFRDAWCATLHLLHPEPCQKPPDYIQEPLKFMPRRGPVQGLG